MLSVLRKTEIKRKPCFALRNCLWTWPSRSSEGGRRNRFESSGRDAGCPPEGGSGDPASWKRAFLLLPPVQKRVKLALLFLPIQIYNCSRALTLRWSSEAVGDTLIFIYQFLKVCIGLEFCKLAQLFVCVFDICGCSQQRPFIKQWSYSTANIGFSLRVGCSWHEWLQDANPCLRSLTTCDSYNCYVHSAPIGFTRTMLSMKGVWRW